MWVARNPPGFAFVWYSDEKDAIDAVKDTDGKSIGGREWRVEIVSRILLFEAPPQGVSYLASAPISGHGR